VILPLRVGKVWRATFTWQITSLPGATVGSDTKPIWRAI
jgi:hypothetical protein